MYTLRYRTGNQYKLFIRITVGYTSAESLNQFFLIFWFNFICIIIVIGISHWISTNNFNIVSYFIGCIDIICCHTVLLNHLLKEKALSSTQKPYVLDIIISQIG